MSEYEFLQFPADAVQVNPLLYATLPDSARRVFDAIRHEGPLTHDQLRRATGLPPRTIRFALKRLREQGCVTSLSSLRDCRARYYFVSRNCIRPDALEAARLRAEEAIRQGRCVERMGRNRPQPAPTVGPQLPQFARHSTPANATGSYPTGPQAAGTPYGTQHASGNPDQAASNYPSPAASSYPGPAASAYGAAPPTYGPVTPYGPGSQRLSQPPGPRASVPFGGRVPATPFSGSPSSAPYGIGNYTPVPPAAPGFAPSPVGPQTPSAAYGPAASGPAGNPAWRSTGVSVPGDNELQ